MFTYSLAVGDYDGDRYLDLIPNAMAGDGNGNQRLQAGRRLCHLRAHLQPARGPAAKCPDRTLPALVRVLAGARTTLVRLGS